MRRKRSIIAGILCAICLSAFPVRAKGASRTAEGEELQELIAAYHAYQADFAALETLSDMEEHGFYLVEDQSFPVVLESFGEEEVFFYSVMDRKYHRLAILIVDQEGKILFKTNRLETNNRRPGELEQPTKGIAAVSFQDLDQDGLTDIILITNCENRAGEYAGKTYRVGDVLFQTKGGFYRDWRISDKINRFSMNKSAKCIASYVRDGNSTEILYTATTRDELLDNGFRVVEEQSYWRTFEKQGYLQILPGMIKMGEFNTFMIFLVNEQGDIVWSFQPMKDYDNLYALKGMACKDLDGDGMKDIVVLARYSYTGPDGVRMIDLRCSIYYQRTDGFTEDTEFDSYYQCTDEDKVSDLVVLIREYWGWAVQND